MDDSDSLAEFLVAAPDRLTQDPVYDVPLAALHGSLLRSLSLPEWCTAAVERPAEAWGERIAVAVGAGAAEEIISHDLSQYVPESLVVSGERAWWSARWKNAEGEATFLLLGPRGDDRPLQRLLGEIGFAKGSRLPNFFSLINGLREGYPDGGFFVTDEIFLLNAEYVEGSFGDFSLGERWDPSLCLFNALNGDVVLANRREECAWWEAGSEATLVPFAESLDAFAGKWAGYRRKLRDSEEWRFWPFDSHGIPRKY